MQVRLLPRTETPELLAKGPWIITMFDIAYDIVSHTNTIPYHNILLP
jgi:hypothetical protein